MTIFLASLIMFGVGGLLFLVGMLLRNEPTYYVGIVLVGAPLPFVCYLAWTYKKQPVPSPIEEVSRQHVYRNPGMKYNKSDSDLQLTAAAATADDGSVVLP